MTETIDSLGNKGVHEQYDARHQIWLYNWWVFV